MSKIDIPPPPPPVIQPQANPQQLEAASLAQANNTAPANTVVNSNATSYTTTAFMVPGISSSSSSTPIKELKPGDLQTALEKRAKDNEKPLNYGAYSNFSGYAVGKDIILNTAKGPHKLNPDASWTQLDAAKKEDKGILDQINKSKNPAAPNPPQETSVAAKVDSEKAKDLADTVKGIAGLRSSLKSLTSLLPSSAGDLIQKTITDTRDKIRRGHQQDISDAYDKGISEGVQKERELAKQLKEHAGENPDQENLKTIKLLERDANEWEEEAKKKLEPAQVVNSPKGSYPRLAMGYGDYFTAGNIEKFKDAINTGKLNGRSIEPEEAKWFVRDAKVYKDIMKGTYNLTPNGEVSVAAHGMAMTLPERSRLEARLRHYGLTW